MKRFVEGTDRGQRTLFAECLSCSSLPRASVFFGNFKIICEASGANY
jgi:hypothetical protein